MTDGEAGFRRLLLSALRVATGRGGKVESTRRGDTLLGLVLEQCCGGFWEEVVCVCVCGNGGRGGQTCDGDTMASHVQEDGSGICFAHGARLASICARDISTPITTPHKRQTIGGTRNAITKKSSSTKKTHIPVL
jgi:hypothetical protein